MTGDELLAGGAQTIDDVFAVFDELPAVDVDQMLGDWNGGLVPTGHPGEAQLDGLRWAGKQFRSANDVDPMICLNEAGERFPNDVLGQAQLRAVEYRGVVTATMIYDRHPILDHFRAIDSDTLLGLMDRKGEAAPLSFMLRRS